MKNSILIQLLLLIGLAFPLVAQQSFNFSIGLNHSYRTLSAQDTSVQVIVDVRNQELPKIVGHFGVHFNQPLSTKWFIKTGINLRSFGYKNPRKPIIWPGQLPGTQTGVFQTKIEYYYLEIPVGVRYNLNQRKWSPFVEISINPSIFLAEKFLFVASNDRQTSFITNRDNVITAYGVFQLTSSFSLGTQYQLTERIQLFTQIGGTYMFSNIVESTKIKERFYGVGIECGVRKIITKSID